MDNSYHENKNIYQFPTQHHYPHHLYSQCPTNLDHSKLQNVSSAGVDSKFAGFMPQNIGLEDHLHLNEPVKSSEAESSNVKVVKKKKSPRKPKAEKVGETKKKSDKAVDTSTFTIEERLVAAVWIHERHHTHHTVPEIMNNFLQRFGRDSPSKTTLFAWERKLFATGNACDAPRPGRPEKRKSYMPSVAASLEISPELSLRARAQALRLPRTTLHSIIKHDMPAAAGDKLAGKPADKLPPKRRVKQPPRKNQPPPPAPPPPPPPAPHPHMHHYVMHAAHEHTHSHGYT